jgi:hypothetical protein
MLRALYVGPVLAILAQAASAQSSWDRYVSRSLKAIIAAHDSFFQATARAMNGAPGRHVSADQFPSKVKERFEHSFRPISAERLEFIQGYFTHVVERPLPHDFLEEEVLVTEDSVQYWLPIQSSLISALRKEAHQGSQVCLFIIWLGALNDGKKLDWIFVVNEFNTDMATCR